MNTRYRTQPRRRGVRGATMVETLVALIVLSIGLLGIAALFVTSIRAARSSVSRLQAVNAVSDLAERIRANPTAKLAYAGAGANQGCVGGALGAANCTPAAMAATDLFLWNQQLGATWPKGTPVAVVTYVAGPPDVYTISLTWNESGEPNPLTYSVNVVL